MPKPIETPDNLATGLALARHFRIFPVDHGTKRPSGGVKFTERATSDTALITAMAGCHPRGGWGILLGPDMMVVDVDAKKGGWESLERLNEKYQLPDTVTSITGGGGAHLFLKLPAEFAGRIDNGVDVLGLNGIDIKTGNGFVVAPGTIHKSGNIYRWLEDHSPDQIGFAEAPRALCADLVRAKTSSPPSAHAGVVPEGSRNDTLFRRAAAMRGKGASEADILAELTKMNARDCKPPLDPDEVLSITKSAARYSPNFEFSDVGNGRRLVAAYETRIRYVPKLKRWFIWDGIRWCEDSDGEMHRLAKAMTDQMLAEAAALKNSAKGALDV